MSSFVETLNQIKYGFDSNSTSTTFGPVKNDMDDNKITLGSHHVNVFHITWFTSCAIIIAVGMFMPCWYRLTKRRLVQQHKDREWVKTKITDPVREKYLLELMKDYSKILSESDICDDDGDTCADSLEDDSFRKRTITEICLKKPSPSSDKPGDEDDHSNDDNDDNVKTAEEDDVEMQRPKRNIVEKNRNANESPDESNDSGYDNDIEMQMSKTKLDVEDEEKEEVETDDGGSTFSEYDDSLNDQRTIFVPLPGQKAIECQGDKDVFSNCNCDSAKMSVEAIESQQRHLQQQRRAYSDGCVVCLNPFEVNQKVTWSSNKDCQHVFHHQCLLEWFDSVGKKAFQKKRIPQNLGPSNDLESIPSSSLSLIEKEICDFATQCPCCRQDYFLEGARLSTDSTEDSDDATSTTTNNNTTAASSAGGESEEEDIELAGNN